MWFIEAQNITSQYNIIGTSPAPTFCLFKPSSDSGSEKKDLAHTIYATQSKLQLEEDTVQCNFAFPGLRILEGQTFGCDWIRMIIDQCGWEPSGLWWFLFPPPLPPQPFPPQPTHLLLLLLLGLLNTDLNLKPHCEYQLYLLNVQTGFGPREDDLVSRESSSSSEEELTPVASAVLLSPMPGPTLTPPFSI